MTVYKTHAFRYRHDGSEWIVHIQAMDASDARARIGKLAYATYDGVHVSTSPIILAPFQILSVWVRNTMIRFMSVGGYQAAMTYVMQAARDQYFEFSKQFLKSLQFMIAGYTMANQPGQWRAGGVVVSNTKTKKVVYEAPPAGMVDSLVRELVLYLGSTSADPVIVRAAMAHLNLVMIHPFKDGNGRVARALQTLVIARDGILHPVFSSIEEWLGDNTEEYYDVLAHTGQGKWSPQRDTTRWVRFCIKAHYQQAAKLLRRSEEAEALYAGVMSIIEREKLPDRTWVALFDSALGLRVTNYRYRTDADISDFTASRDLKRLAESELLVPQGEKRQRVYTASKEIIALRKATRIQRSPEDPYEIVNKISVRSAAEEVRLPGI